MIVTSNSHASANETGNSLPVLLVHEVSKVRSVEKMAVTNVVSQVLRAITIKNQMMFIVHAFGASQTNPISVRQGRAREMTLLNSQTMVANSESSHVMHHLLVQVVSST
jgi:hypothetical protein